MTFEKILNNLTSKQITPKEAKDAICDKDMFKRINYYIHYNNISNQPMNDQQLQELNSIVNILQILYTSDVGSPIDDSSYDTLEEANRSTCAVIFTSGEDALTIPLSFRF